MSPVASQPSRMTDEAHRSGATFHGDRGALMRSLLRPRPIPGIENFGIPPSPEGEVNPTVQVEDPIRFVLSVCLSRYALLERTCFIALSTHAKMEQFQNIKATRGIHFNQSLMKNKNFRNPHIYSSLVDLVALNEIGSNFDKKEFFDFEGYGPECYAAGLGKLTKKLKSPPSVRCSHYPSPSNISLHLACDIILYLHLEWAVFFFGCHRLLRCLCRDDGVPMLSVSILT
ncbi:MAG: hypothetical protein BYD32DRAFT_95676 [Podila humilis]|nr:MAG: hypothetical protein BYD32DRAFT_95676 [Podila humilis]